MHHPHELPRHLHLRGHGAAVEHRIRVAGGNGNVIDEAALKALYVASRGVPREIMKIANASLLLAAVNQVKPVNEEIIKLAVENILKTDEQQPETAELRAGAKGSTRPTAGA